jgi:adenine phosphoribosyltransferase
MRGKSTVATSLASEKRGADAPEEANAAPCKCEVFEAANPPTVLGLILLFCAGNLAGGAHLSDLRRLVRTIPNYPKPGILFRDVTTLMGDAKGFKAAIEGMAAPYHSENIDAVAGIEARGFILGGAVADRLSCGFIPIRKKGKLPWKTIGQQYSLEYGVDIIEMHEDAVKPGERILIVDDLIATGGTAEAAAKLISRTGGLVAGAAFLVDLPDLGGLDLLRSHGIRTHALMAFEGH